MDKALLVWIRVISWTGIFTNIISDRDPKLTSVLWKNLHQLFGTKLFFSTAKYPQTDGLAERMITTLEDVVRRFWKGYNLKLPQDLLRKDLLEIHPTASSFKGMLEKARKHAIKCMEDSCAYSKDRWDRSHVTSDLRVGDLVIVSITNSNKIKGFEFLKDSFAGPFLLKALHG
ncbi:hypothetical protein O181_009500 [Austropuccinia psidii MF-1]|uniref:Integrase catalytic domain-containing protein n=1 Tax=Austropuccinia psidii MF-1 TaxID=1389203 RepID=A0A9Q3BS31_9BASI|nr:hypothetical protein [Austropuccinia psidii MF-1]